MRVLETDRLILSRLSIEDAPVVLSLLNEPSFLHFIGDKSVRTLDDARGYLLKGPIAHYERFGFGPYLTRLKEGEVPIGMCGLTKKESLKDADIGFAFFPKFWGNGYAIEAATAVMAYGKSALGLSRIVGVVSPDNLPSIRVLEKLGLRFEHMVKLSEGGPEVKLLGESGR